MARIAGVDLPDDKVIEIALTEIYGIGRALSREVLAQVDIEPTVRTKELDVKDINKLREIIENDYTVEGDLRRERRANVKRLKEIGSYRGERHEKDLPVRGQQTQTNSRTVRGNTRRTVRSGRKGPPSPT